MLAFLVSILADPTVIAVLAAIAGLFGFGIHQRRAGAKAERAKRAQAEAKARDIKDQVQNDVGALPPDAVRAELAKRARK